MNLECSKLQIPMQHWGACKEGSNHYNQGLCVFLWSKTYWQSINLSSFARCEVSRAPSRVNVWCDWVRVHDSTFYSMICQFVVLCVCGSKISVLWLCCNWWTFFDNVRIQKLLYFCTTILMDNQVCSFLIY